MDNLAYPHTKDLILCFTGGIDGGQIGIDDNAFRGDNQHRVLDGVKKLIATIVFFCGASEVLAFLGI